MTKKKLNVGVIGVGRFAGSFIRLYKQHPDVGAVAVCARNPETLNARADALDIDKDLRFTNMDDMIKSNDIDAIHVLTPTFAHYEHEMKVLEAGKHLAVAVSMAETVDQLKDIVRKRREVGKTFMLMETSAYTRDILKAERLIRSGDFGRIQFISASHMQNTQLYEDLGHAWDGYPPLLYGSHATAPIYCLTGKMAESVMCLGSGDIGPELTKFYDCKDSYQCALVNLKDSDIKAEVHRTMFHCCRQCREHFDVYGSKMSYEWAQLSDEGAVVYSGMDEGKREFAPLDTTGLPSEFVFTGTPGTYAHWTIAAETLEYAQSIGHGGSYPHLVHEWVSACLEGRDSHLDAEVAANMTAIGILAVESARQGGKKLDIPDFYNI